MAKIILPSPFRKFTDNATTFEAHGSTVKEAMTHLTMEYPDLSQYLFDSQNNIRSFIRIYIDDNDINELEQEETSVDISTIISIVPAIAGG